MNLANLNKRYLSTCLLLFLVFPLVLYLNQKEIGNNIKHNTIEYTSPCPAQTEVNRGIMEDFLSSSAWKSNRQETNTDMLSTSQITLLTSPEFTNICDRLNSKYEAMISKTWKSGESRYNLTYYKVGNYYFVIISLNQPSDTSRVAVGSAFLNIHDKNLNRIIGYSF